MNTTVIYFICCDSVLECLIELEHFLLPSGHVVKSYLKTPRPERPKIEPIRSDLFKQTSGERYHPAGEPGGDDIFLDNPFAVFHSLSHSDRHTIVSN